MLNLYIKPNATWKGSQLLFTFLNTTTQNQHQISARTTYLKLIKIQTVLMKCAVNLGVSFAQDNAKSKSFTAIKQTDTVN